MNVDILLLGAGQLGSRYLQGLVKSKVSLNIAAVDPSSAALSLARVRWLEAGGGRCHHQVSWLDSIPRELSSVHLVLLVTPAKGRAHLVERIAAQIAVGYWVIEKVLAQSEAELEVIKRALSRSRGAWVNTPRRMMSLHQNLRKEFLSRGPIKCGYSGGQWGLACNSIHFLDLISWWSSERLESIDTSGLDALWFESKRAGYSEVSGKLLATYSLGTTLTLEARNEYETKALQVELADGTLWTVNEVCGIARSANGEQVDGRFELQSQLSTRLVEGILTEGQCDLPTLEESTKMHSVYLEAMLNHWNFSHLRNDQRIPIT